MGFKKTMVAGGLAAALMLPGLASAGIDFRFNWGATNQGQSGAATMSDPVREMKFTAESAIVFDGVPFTPGTTFTDYIALRIDQLFDSNGDQILSPYGPGSSMQITIMAQLRGVQMTAQDYVVNTVDRFDIYYDGPIGGFTNASFAGLLANFSDGQLVEQGTAVDGTGSNSPLAPDGVLDLTVALADLLEFDDFEVTVAGGPIGSHLFGITNSNNHLCAPSLQTCASNANAILAAFGVGPNANAIHTKSDGSIEKLAVPEPSSLALIGLALAGAGFAGRRRKALKS